MGEAIRPALAARLALAKYDFQFTRALGQNFLLDDGYIGRIADEAAVRETSHVLEIGAGAGVLTAELASRGANVLALEIDRALEPVLRDVLLPFPRVRLAFEDAERADLLRLTQEAFGEGERFQVVANLPYHITTGILTRLLTSDLPMDSVTVLTQKEAADRILSKPGMKAWCALSVLTRYFGKAQVCLDIPPQAFTPAPRVTSSLLRIEMYREKPARARDEKVLLALVRTAFAMRRKTLVNNLTAALGLSRAEALRMLAECGLDALVRGEALSVPQLCALADKIAVLHGLLK